MSKQKYIDYIEKWPCIVIFLYILYIFDWIQHDCLAHHLTVLDIRQLEDGHQMCPNKNI